VCGLVLRVVIEDADLAGFAEVSDLQLDAEIRVVVLGRDSEIGYVLAGGAAFEGAQETVWAIDGQIISARLRDSSGETSEKAAHRSGKQIPRSPRGARPGSGTLISSP